MSEMHLMIDLETLGVRPDARVLEIGAASFYLDGDGPLKTFTVCLDVGRQNGSVDAGTVDFWLKQPEAARKHIYSSKKLPPIEALEAFEAAFTPWGEIKGLWSHGPAFDVTILQTLYARYGRAVPWSYKTVRDTRTLQFAVQQLGMKPAEYPSGGTMHAGDDDAANQALWVQRMVRQLRSADPLAS
jgi:exodeoxyribonuclease VIII